MAKVITSRRFHRKNTWGKQQSHYRVTKESHAHFSEFIDSKTPLTVSAFLYLRLCAFWSLWGLSVNRSFLLAALLSVSTLCAHAQNASQALSFVVPYPAGGPLDTSAHLLASSAQKSLGAITVLNKPGEGGMKGVDLIAKAKPQDNMIVMGAVATHAVLPHLNSSISYNAEKDFKPILLVARVPNVLVMSKARAEALNLQSTQDLLAYIKANPGALKMGSAGKGSIGHIAGEVFKSLVNLRIDNQLFEGATATQKALLDGQVDMVFDNLASALPMIESGKLLALSVTSLGRNMTLPKVPPMNEAVPGFDLVTWFGIFAPASLPDQDAQRYALAFKAALNDPLYQSQYRKMGIAQEDMQLRAFSDFVSREGRKFQFLIRATKIKAG
ncbi:tripartite tricarboxylate transporter substrate binding protein [Comamonas sp. Y33R10-2]|nr:tripartite tricarboxylate transporter substrate binding protein [Comamonas sp. Y33R10-2]